MGVKVESTGLACWAWDGGALRADEMKEEDEPDRQDEAMVVVVAGQGSRALVGVLGTPPFCASCCVTVAGTRRATERRLSGGCSRCSR